MDVVEELVVRCGVTRRGLDGDAFRCVRATMRLSGGRFGGGFNSMTRCYDDDDESDNLDLTMRSFEVVQRLAACTL